MKNHSQNEIFVTPAPQNWHFDTGHFRFDQSVAIYTIQDFINPAHFLKAALQTDHKLTLDIHPVTQNSMEKKGIYILSPDFLNIILKTVNDDRTRFTPVMENEGYILIIRKQYIFLISKSTAGAFYGIQTLRFLTGHNNNQIQLPQLTIQDWPDMQIRGFSDDISRGQVSTPDHFKRIIRYLARYKMNVYMPYIEDLFQFKNYPAIGKNRGALSAKECIELQDYAAQYFVDIIPVFQTLGHYENLLIQPEFMSLADFPGAASLDITSDDTYSFLEKCLDEIVPVFRSVYFHMGADESYDVGSGASRSDTLKHGIAAVHAKHYNKVYQLLKKYDKKIIMYGDIVLEHPGILKDLPRDIMILDWHYDIREHYESTGIFDKSGHDFIVSPGNQNWSRIFPDLERARKNIHNIIDDGHAKGALGAITSSWGDFGGANLRELNYYQIAYAAHNAWNKNKNNLEQFEQAFFRDFYGSDDPGFKKTYDTLSRYSEYYDLNYFFAHPFYPLTFDRDKLNRRSTELTRAYGSLISELQELKVKATRNKKHLDIPEFCASLYHWTALLNQIQLELDNSHESSPELLMKQLSVLEKKLLEIKSTFKDLWLRYNKPDNLERILNLYDRVQKQLAIKKTEIKNSNLDLNGRLETPFISCPCDPETEKPGQVIYLRKKFSLRGPAETAWLHVIADSHAHIWLNGQKAAELVATRTLSAIVEAERVKMWNVAEYLVKGENTLAVKVSNYKPESMPSVNLILNCPELKFRITGDDNWKVHNREENNWQACEFTDSYWENAVRTENKWIISRPYFEHGLPGRIEFFRTPIY